MSHEIPDVEFARRFLAYLDMTRANIRANGWAVQAIFSPDGDITRGWAYTIGLTELEHPELCITGLPPALAQDLLNQMGERVRKGALWTDGDEVHNVVAGLPLRLRAVATDDGDWFRVGRAIYPGMTVLQAVWPAPDGTYTVEDSVQPMVPSR